MKTIPHYGSLNRLDFIILLSLQKNDAINPIKAISINEMKQYCPIAQSYSTFYRALQKLQIDKYISYGAKDGKNMTYYLNQNGINAIKECC